MNIIKRIKCFFEGHRFYLTTERRYRDPFSGFTDDTIGFDVYKCSKCSCKQYYIAEKLF